MIDTSKVIHAPVGGGRYTVTAPIVKEDYGLYLKIEGLELPSTYEVDFSNSEHNGTSVTMIGNADGVLIPHQFIDSGKDIFAFLYHAGDNYGRTVFKFRIPNKLRPDRTDEEPTPEEQSVIDQCISALNSAVAQTAQDVIDADASAQSAQEYAEQAETARDTAQTYANNAQTSANNASASASQASASATASANSASQSAQIKSDVQGMVSDAQGYAQSASQSATASANSASQASASATSASQSASSASGYATSAQTSAQTASSKASEASTSAQTASQKATESAQSASQALSYKTDAETAKTASQTAQGLAESARDSAQGYAEDAQGYAEDAQASAESVSASASQIAQNTADIASLEEDRYKPYVTDSASGSIASFPDGADDIPLKSLVVDINPVQDLHGYDSPWVGGGGKNLIDSRLSAVQAVNTNGTWSGNVYTLNGLTFTVADDGHITINGTSTANTYFTVYRNSEGITLSTGSYVLHKSGSADIIVAAPKNGSYWTSATTNDSVVSLTESARVSYYVQIQNGKTISNYNLYPMIEAGTTATSWTPYENICPISGWTQVHPNISGINVWDEEWEVGGIRPQDGTLINEQRIRSKNLIPCVPNTTYYILDPTNNNNIRVFYYAKNGSYIGCTSFIMGAQTTPNNARFMRFIVATTYGATYNHDISINYPGTDHSYHPYTGRSITINLGQTVYGGHLDVLTGVMTITHKGVDMGTLSWNMQAGSGTQLPRFNTTGIASDVSREQTQPSYPVMLDLKAPILSPHNDPVYSRAVDNSMCVLCSNGTLYAICSSYSSAADFKTAVSGMILVYRLANPIEIQLSPTEVKSLYGQNNIFADTGDTEVTYRADTTLYIQRLTEPDADMIADSNIVSGQYFMVGNSLFKATANIASGASVIVGTNAIRKSLSEALNEINA